MLIPTMNGQTTIRRASNPNPKKTAVARMSNAKAITCPMLPASCITASTSCVNPSPAKKLQLPPATAITVLTSESPAIQKNQLAEAWIRLTTSGSGALRFATSATGGFSCELRSPKIEVLFSFIKYSALIVRGRS